MIECTLAFLIAGIVGAILLSIARRGTDPDSGRSDGGDGGDWR